VVETLGVEELHLGQSKGNEDAEKVTLKVWWPPWGSPFVDQVLWHLGESQADEDRVRMAAWLLNDVWEPGRPRGQRVLPAKKFSWRNILKWPELCDRLRLSTERVVDIQREIDEHADELEDAARSLGTDSDDPATIISDSFGTGVEPAPLAEADYRTVLRVTVEEFERWKHTARAPAPPANDRKANAAYRRVLRRRIEAGMRRAGIGRATLDSALRRAASLAAEVRSLANAQILEVLEGLDGKDRPDRIEIALFRWLHVRTIPVGGGLQMRPLAWEPVFRSLVAGMTNRSKERLVYVHCTEGVRFPPEWRAETHRLLGGYLRLYGEFLRQTRQGERDKKGKAAAKSQARGTSRDVRFDDPDGEETRALAQMEDALGEATGGLILPAEQLSVVSDKVATLREPVRSMGLFTSPDRRSAIQEEIIQAQDSLVDAIAGSALLRVGKALRYFLAYEELGGGRGAHQQVATKFRVARSSVSESLALAARKCLVFVEQTPACRGFMVNRLRELGLGKYLRGSSKGR
jgi:GNAT superfamily N-acetyltransferase